jgi:hypothetical protein
MRSLLPEITAAARRGWIGGWGGWEGGFVSPAAVFGVEVEPFARVRQGETAWAAGTLGLNITLVRTAKSLTPLC